MTSTKPIDHARLDWSAHADPSRWPISEHIFLADAVQRVGEAICHPWDPGLPSAMAFNPSPFIPGPDDAFVDGQPIAAIHELFAPVIRSVVSPATFAELQLRDDRAAWLASHVADPAGGSPLPALALRARNGEDRDDPVTYDHWNDAGLVAALDGTLAENARKAMPEVARAIAELAFDADIETFARPLHGGEMVPLLPALWALDDPLPRIATCTLRLDDPFNPDADGDHRIFVGDTGLDTAIATLAARKWLPLADFFIDNPPRMRPDRLGESVEQVKVALLELMADGDHRHWTKSRFRDEIARRRLESDGVVFDRAWLAATEKHREFTRPGRRFGT